MGDMKEYFDDLKEHHKKRITQNLANGKSKFKELVKLVGIVIRHTEWHWGLTLLGSKLDYWPSRNKWRWQNKLYYGTAQDLQNFIGNLLSKVPSKKGTK